MSSELLSQFWPQLILVSAPTTAIEVSHVAGAVSEVDGCVHMQCSQDNDILLIVWWYWIPQHHLLHEWLSSGICFFLQWSFFRPVFPEYHLSNIVSMSMWWQFLFWYQQLFLESAFKTPSTYFSWTCSYNSRNCNHFPHCLSFILPFT